ncbi:hypothetical protein V5P93_003873 [Actinokineospora auranticolor]|uniref:Allene oxide cyclase barrel-like domain-containing protein n=1 Tax=Actinokineospora auranticolor TaxID=155976 RepID=A0A2S6GLP9_9PSEU|nr:hypothetical protein [Actinokineospora auranticolor]PPK66158.1 hypothetical protein CLV40_111122 [Actinokineospora auranticolor]
MTDVLSTDLTTLAEALKSALGHGSTPTPDAPAVDVDPATGWLTLPELTERVLGGEGEITPVPRVGQVRRYHDEIHTVDGALVGRTEGRLEIVAERAADGHAFAVRTEHVRLYGELFVFSGVNDITAEFAGGWVSTPGVGVTGRYLGVSAVRRILMTPTPMVSRVVLSLCP